MFSTLPVRSNASRKVKSPHKCRNASRNTPWSIITFPCATFFNGLAASRSKLDARAAASRATAAAASGPAAGTAGFKAATSAPLTEEAAAVAEEAAAVAAAPTAAAPAHAPALLLRLRRARSSRLPSRRSESRPAWEAPRCTPKKGREERRATMCCVGSSKSISCSSSSVFVPQYAATIEPADVPERMRGIRLSLCSAITTPMCLTPKAPPPESSRAVRP
mmetsp:Transcript_34482/g.110774  ORF Transcript_34482/g.110774 Transcript_34482/m.110774 type:complete len:220 (-) Transcript_34482:684-1343(-)